jgi:hypothetical protein
VLDYCLIRPSSPWWENFEPREVECRYNCRYHLDFRQGWTLHECLYANCSEVVFEGNTSFGYAEWSGSLFSVSGTNITVKGAPGSFLDGQGALYWDGLGNGGGVTKPKFFKAK